MPVYCLISVPLQCSFKVCWMHSECKVNKRHGPDLSVCKHTYYMVLVCCVYKCWYDCLSSIFPHLTLVCTLLEQRSDTNQSKIAHHGCSPLRWLITGFISHNNVTLFADKWNLAMNYNYYNTFCTTAKNTISRLLRQIGESRLVM